jgi:hypothetical protein
LPNFFGINVKQGSAGNQIGTTGLSDYGDRNVLSGNLQLGVALDFAGANQNLVAGNDIGTSATGTQLIRNGPDNAVAGVVIAWTAQDNQIGGLGLLATTPPNVIAFNGGPGVWVISDATYGDNTTGNSIRDNSIHDNAGLGIDLGGDYDGYTLTDVPGPDGVTLNDSEGHSSPNNPNNFQDFPLLGSAVSSSTDTTVTGTFSWGTESGLAGQPITLDFYANSSPAHHFTDGHYYGEGQTYLGSITVATDPSGAPVTFLADLPVGNLAGQWISATATDANGNTSEISADVQATASSQTFAQDLRAALPQSTTGPNSLSIEANPSTINEVVAALSPANLGPSVNAVNVYLNLATGTYTAQTVSVPNGMTLYINGVPGTTIDPAGPAFTLTSGNAVLSNVTFVTTGDAPTILVTGGNLTLRDDVIQESAAFNDAAIAVTGGTLDLGTATDPGGNTLNINGAGTFLRNTTANRIPAVGDTFEINGQVTPWPVPLTVTTNSSLMLVGNSPPPLTGSVNGMPFTGSTTYTTAFGDQVTVTLGTAATATSPVGRYAITATLSGADAGNYLIDPTTSATGTMYVVSVGADPSSSTGARAVSFWDNRGNARLITAADLTSLDGLNLVGLVGTDFDPHAASQLQAWLGLSSLLARYAPGLPDEAFQLSAQLAALDLNVLSGYVHATDLVYAGALLPYASTYGITGLTSGGFIDVEDLMSAANTVLGQVRPGILSADPNRAYEAALAQVLTAVDANGDFVTQELLWGLAGTFG